MFDAALVDEWIFVPSTTFRIGRSVRMVVVAGLALAALTALLAFRAATTPTAEAEVLGITEVRAVAGLHTVRGVASFEIVNGEMDGSALVDMTVKKVSSGEALGLAGKTLRLEVAPGGRLVSITGLGDGLSLDPGTGAPTLMSALSGQRVVTSQSWTAPVQLRLVSR